MLEKTVDEVLEYVDQAQDVNKKLEKRKKLHPNIFIKETVLALIKHYARTYSTQFLMSGRSNLPKKSPIASKMSDLMRKSPRASIMRY